MESSEHELILPLVRDDNICLPLSINAVSRYWNVDLPMSEAVEISRKYPGINGSILMEGIELAERSGLASAILRGDLAGLRRIIDAGIPPIVILPGVHDTVQHASVISGYDDAEGTVMHYIPDVKNDDEFQVGVIPDAQFDKLWSEDGRLMILLAPAEALAGVDTGEESRAESNRLCFLSEKLSLLKKTDEAAQSLRRAIDLDGNNSTAYSMLGSLYNEQNSSECVGYYEKSIELNAESFLAHRGLGNYYLKSKNHTLAEEHYTRALKINPTRYGPVYKNRAITKMELGRNADAKSDLLAYLKHTPAASDRESILKAIDELD